MKGIDFAFDPHPSIAVEKANGVTFVCRYISPSTANDVNGKNLVPAEKAALLAAGLSIVMVFESSGGRMLAGRAAGVADAQDADAVVRALGMPGMPVYFAADWDATEADQALINAYLDGTASVIGHARNGIYGGYWPVSRALDAGKASFGWQTYAWSGGQWDKRAQLRQTANGVSMGGADADIDASEAADFGQWPRPAAAAPAAPFPAPAGVSITPRDALAISWGLSRAADGTPSPHYRVQVMEDAAGKPGAVIDGGSQVETGNHALIAVPRPGAYWVRVQAAGDSPFTAPKRATA